MGTNPAMAEPVTSMRDFLEETLAEAEEMDARIHEGIHRLRERIAALKLAEDAAFVAEHVEFSETYDPDAEPGLTADEFAERYLTPR